MAGIMAPSWSDYRACSEAAVNSSAPEGQKDAWMNVLGTIQGSGAEATLRNFGGNFEAGDATVLGNILNDMDKDPKCRTNSAYQAMKGGAREVERALRTRFGY